MFSSCASVETGKKFKSIAYEDKDKAILYIYRPKTDFNWAGWPNIFIDDQKK